MKDFKQQNSYEKLLVKHSDYRSWQLLVFPYYQSNYFLHALLKQIMTVWQDSSVLV
jgi:hypothetical protein